MTKEHIGKYLSMTQRAHASVIDRRLEPYDIGYGQVLLLISLYKKDGICQYTLCETYNFNKSAVSKGIKKLEKTGFIIKGPDSNDKRKTLIHLTKKAKDFKKEFQGILHSIEEEMRAGLNEDEIDKYLEISKKMYTNLRNEGFKSETKC